MASTFRLFQSGNKYQPAPRYRHAAQTVGNRVLLYNGRVQDLSERSQRRLASTVNVFNHAIEQWEEKDLTGDTPSGLLSAAVSTSLDCNLYLYGGWDGSRFTNNLFKISYQDDCYQCSRLSRSNAGSNCPMPKFGAGLVAYGDNVGLFGGYGIANDATEPGSPFIKNSKVSDCRGWTNEFHIYSLKEGSNNNYYNIHTCTSCKNPNTVYT